MRGDNLSGLIFKYIKLFSPIPNIDTKTKPGSKYQYLTVKDEDDFKLIYYPKLRPKTPLSKPD
jgi:hypothetical protein